jgi:hypothetical protein
VKQGFQSGGLNLWPAQPANTRRWLI